MINDNNLTSAPTMGSTLRSKLFWPLLMFFIVYGLGIAGYWGIMQNTGTPRSGWNCFYQVGILLTGVGFTDFLESHNSVSGTIFTVSLSLFGVAFILYVMSTVTAFIVSGELSQMLGRERMRKKIDALKNHFIICGCGVTGLHVVNELIVTHRPFVIIETNSERLDFLRQELGDILYIQADASDDNILLQAGIDKAEGLISALPNDKDNLLVTITARQLNSDFRIIARCVDKKNVSKLKKIGANSVVCPNMIGGLRMVSEMIRPTVVTFLDVMLRDKRQIRIEEATIAEGSKYAGMTLKEVVFPELADINIIATRSPEADDFTYNPHGFTKLQAGTILVMIASPKEIDLVRKAVRA